MTGHKSCVIILFIMTKEVGKTKKKDITGTPYTEYFFTTDFGKVTFSITEEKHVMVDVVANGEPNDISTYFLIKREQLLKLIELVEADNVK